MTTPTGTGGWRPGLVTTPGPLTEEASFLASEHLMAKRVGATFDSTLVGADDDGNKVLTAGTVVEQDAVTNKWREYAGTGAEDQSGFLLETINLRDGDVVSGVLLHGSVLSARVSGLTSGARTALEGRIIFQ